MTDTLQENLATVCREIQNQDYLADAVAIIAADASRQPPAISQAVRSFMGEVILDCGYGAQAADHALEAFSAARRATCCIIR